MPLELNTERESPAFACSIASAFDLFKKVTKQ